jgi:hypothetical protein
MALRTRKRPVYQNGAERRTRELVEDYRPRLMPYAPPGYYETPPDAVDPNRYQEQTSVTRNRGINKLGQNMRALCESVGPQEAANILGRLLQSGEIKHTNFSIKELAEAFCGRDWVERLNPQRGGQYQRSVMEGGAGQGVDVSAFSDIIGQIFFTRILEGWRNATLVAEKIFDRQPTEFSGEKLPWLSHVIQEGQPIQSNMPYPEANFGERWVQTPYTQKWGMIVSVTREMIFFDRTGQVTRAAYEVGKKLGYNKEKRCLVCFMGMTNTYSLNGTTYNTYNVGPQSPPSYANAQASTPFVDYSSLQTPLTLFSQILDPDTLNPLDTPDCKDLFVLPARLLHARAVVKASEYWGTNPAFNSSPAAGEPYGNLQMHSPNPWMDGALNIITSPIAYQLLTAGSQVYAPAWVNLTANQANEYWWVGDFKRAFNYMENWPITVVQAPPQSIREFEQDLVLRYKVSEMGTPAVIEPRYLCRLNNS